MIFQTLRNCFPLSLATTSVVAATLLTAPVANAAALASPQATATQIDHRHVAEAPNMPVKHVKKHHSNKHHGHKQKHHSHKR